MRRLLSRRSRLLPLAAVLLLTLPGPAAAQFALRSRIEGTIVDQSGAAVPGATVTLHESTRNLSLETVSGPEGEFAFPNLASGNYQVSATLTGFATARSEPLLVSTQATLRVNLVLQPAGVAETVTVTRAAPLVSTDQIAIGATADHHLVETLGSKGRNFTSFVQLAPAVSTDPRPNSAGTFAAGTQHVVGGVSYTAGGGGNNGFYIDGVNVNENYVGGLSYSPSLEAVDEVKVDVANFSAANGRDVSTLTATTRAGSNTFHGAGFEYFQGGGLNAWNPLDKLRADPGTEKPDFTRHQFGGNLGGPAVKNRLFFFANYEELLNKRPGQPVFFRVPTEAERQGDFSELLRRFPGDPNYVLYDPYSTVVLEDGETVRTPVPNNDLRTLRRPDGTPALDPRAIEMLGLFPMPNYTDPTDPDNLENFQGSEREQFKSGRLDTRVDFTLGDNDNIYGNFSRSHGIDDNSDGLFPEIVTSNVDDKSWRMSVNYARVFTPTLTNELLAGYGRGTLCLPDQGSVDYMHQTDTLRAKHFTNLGSGDDLGLYAMDLPGYYSFGASEVFCASNRSFQVGDNLTWVKGRHTIKSGFNYFLKAEKDFDYIRFVGFDTTGTRAGTVDESLGGDSVASFLLGLPTYMQQRYSLTGGDDGLNFKMPYWGFYAEDKWQVSDKWTLNAGLRYELNPPLYSGNRYGNAIVDMSVPDWQMAIPGRAPGLDLHYLPADKTAFAPRVGVAFQPDDRWVFRANYGIFYDLGLSYDGSEVGSALDAAFGGVPGYVGSFYDSARFGEPEDVPVLTFDQIFPPADEFTVGTYPISTGEGTGYFDFPANVKYLDQDSNGSPHYHRYVVSADRVLGQDLAISVFYSGSRGRDLPYYFNQNIPDYRTGWPSEDAFNEARPNANGRFANVLVLRHGLESTYNAGTVRIDRRLSRGLQLVAHYTYSKTIADRIQFGDFAWNWHPELGRGEADFSHPHRFVVAGTWEIPSSDGFTGLSRALLADWTLSGIYTYESGNALTVVNTQSSARDFEPDMPNVSGDPNDGPHTVDQWFNVAAFSDPGFDVKGNARPGIVRGPPINNLDLSIAKTVRSRGVKVLLRVDMFNALNHPQWLDVNTEFSSAAGSNFGRIESARDGRIVQLGARVSF